MIRKVKIKTKKKRMKKKNLNQTNSWLTQKLHLLQDMMNQVLYEFEEHLEPDSEETWIEWFCKRKGHEFICEVDKNYIEY